MNEKTRNKYLSRGKDRSRSEMEKLRDMDFKRKVEYIWEYYRPQIIGGGVGLILLLSLLNTLIFNPPPNVGLFIAWSAGFVEQDRLDDLVDTLTEQLVFESEGDVAEVSLLLTGVNDPQMAMAHAQRLVAMIAAGAIDAFVLDRELLEEYSYAGFIAPLTSLLSVVEHMNPDVYARIIEESVYALHSYDDEHFSEQIMGIRLLYSPLLVEHGVVNSDWYWMDWYFSVAVSTHNLGNVARALILMFE